MKRELYPAWLALVAICSVSACSADITTITSPAGVFNNKKNLIALPGIPVEPSPVKVFSAIDSGDGMGLDARLTRWIAPFQSVLLWDAWDQNAIDKFGNMLVGDGYWLTLGSADPKQFSYKGLTDTDGMDTWISLPRTGMTLIGNPHSYSVKWESIEVTDGTKTVSMSDACRKELWIDPLVYGFDSSRQRIVVVGMADDYPDSEFLEPWHGYWVKSLKNNIALIVPGNQP